MAKGSQGGISNNPKGKPKGTKSTKTKQWEALAEDIVTIHAKRFNIALSNLEDEDFVKIYKDILNYFKPKISYNINKSEDVPLARIEIKEIGNDQNGTD